MDNIRQSASFFLLLALVTGCADSAREASSVVVRDSAGIEIIENAAPIWQSLDQWTITPEPVLVIGMLDGPAEYQLDRVEGAVRLEDGRIVVADGGTRQLRYFDAEGRFIEAVGREGAGPGEFQDLGQIFRLLGDSVAAWDPRQKRLTVFSADGQLSRLTQAGMVDGMVPPIAGLFDDGSLVVRPGITLGVTSASTGEITRDSVLFLRVDAAGSRADTFGVFPGTETSFIQGDWGSSRSPIPFGRAGHLAISHDRYWYGDDASYSIAEYTSEGSLQRLIRRAHEAVPVSPDDVDEYYDNRSAIPATAPAPMRALLAQRAEAERQELPHRETLPAFALLLPDATGNLWVEEARKPTDAQLRWSVFDEQGRWLGIVDTPADLHILEIGEDWLLGRYTAELDVQYVHLYGIEKGNR